MNKKKKLIWVSPWGYPEGWLFCLGLLATGMALQLSIGGLSPTALAWPVNIAIGGVFTAFLIIGWVFFKKNNFINWLGRVPAALTSIALITFLVIIMGFTLQDSSQNPAWVQTLGLSEMTRSWPFLFAMFFFLASLGMATLKRLVPFKGRNIGFFLNHAGLYIAILAGMLGAADLQRYTMEIYEGEIVWVAQNNHGHLVEMPLALQLVSFNKEEFKPKAAVIERWSDRIAPEGLRQMFEVNTGNSSTIMDWDIEIVNFQEFSGRIGERYEAVNSYGAAPSAFVTATHRQTGAKTEGWISSGSFMHPHEFLYLNVDYALAMTIPRASSYSSDVVIYSQSGEVREERIEVNHPVSAEGWKLYQYSYDDRFGRWSPSSVIEAIRDPWLPVVYTGIFMLLAGSVYLMTLGKAPEEVKGDAS